MADLDAVATLTADHETKGSYSVTIVATTTDADTSRMLMTVGQ